MKPEPWQTVEEIHVDIRCGACASRRADARPPVLAHVERRVYRNGTDTGKVLSTPVRRRPFVMGPGPGYPPRPSSDFQPRQQARKGGAFVLRANSHRETRWLRVTTDVIELSCRRASCGHQPKRNVAKLIAEAERAHRRGLRDLLV